jgi:hypothetical protein
MKDKKARFIKNFKQFRVNETTEFNFLRLNPDSVQASVSVDDPALSINAFDKHQDSIRAAMSRINDILYNLSGTNAYKNLRSKLALEKQDITAMKIIRIVKSNNINYDAYVSFVIDEKEYWGVIKNILTTPDVQSEVFKDGDLLQTKEWVIKTKGLISKVVKTWLKPEPGKYSLINDEIICYSVDTGKMLKMEKGTEIDLVRAFDNKMLIKHDNEYYNLIGDNFIFFNWWFDPIL